MAEDASTRLERTTYPQLAVKSVKEEDRQQRLASMTDHLVAVAVADAFMQFSQATVSAVRAPDPIPSPRVPSFTHSSSALTNKGRVLGSSRPRTTCAHCGMNATMRSGTSTSARSRLARGSPRLTGGRLRRVNYTTGSLHALTSFLSCFYVHAYTIDG